MAGIHALVTGATGYVGASVARALARRGHRVTGLARSETAAALLRERGHGVLRGDLAGLPTSDEAAAALDGVDVVVHAAKNRSGERGHETGDAAVVDAILAAASRRRAAGRPELAAVYTSGCFSFGNTPEAAVLTEATDADRGPPELAWRLRNERRLEAGLRRWAVPRCALVWGRSGSHGSRALDSLRLRGRVEMPGTGGRLPWIHVDDLGDAYALLAERITAADEAGPAASGVYIVSDGRDSIEHARVMGALAAALFEGGGGGTDAAVRSVDVVGEFAGFLNLRQGRHATDKIKALGWDGPRHGSPVDGASVWARDLLGRP